MDKHPHDICSDDGFTSCENAIILLFFTAAAINAHGIFLFLFSITSARNLWLGVFFFVFFYSASGKQVSAQSHVNVGKSVWQVGGTHMSWDITYVLLGIVVTFLNHCYSCQLGNFIKKISIQLKKVGPAVISNLEDVARGGYLWSVLKSTFKTFISSVFQVNS